MVSNKQSKFIKSLKIKKYRSKEMCFLAEGRKNVLEGLANGLKVKYLLATSEFVKDNKQDLSIVESQLIECTNTELTDLGTFTTNNDCLAVFEIPVINQPLDHSQHIVLLDGVSDPGNLGTIIRTMDWFGFNQLICSKDTTDFYNPKVINATMGSFARMHVNYANIVDTIKDSPMEAYGADLNGTPLDQWKAVKPTMLVMGSESHGLSREVHDVLSGRVTIPKVGATESLNVAIATGILCHHMRFNLS